MTTKASRRLLHDGEMVAINRICQQLALLRPDARRRVLAYVCARSESLPVLAAVGGGIEDEPTTPPMFNVEDVPEGEPPMMPSLAGARA
jgi:hypothetical protein